MPRRFKKEYRKEVVPKGEYLATIVHGNFDYEKKSFLLWWVIDTGKYLGHKISREYPASEGGERMLKRDMGRLKCSYFPGLPDMSDIFYLQFIGRRGKITVDIRHEGDFTRNVITYHQVALHPPEENVIRSKAVDHFYENKSKRTLPIS